MSDEEEFDTSQGFDLRTWLSLFSYEKFHASGYGLGLAFLAALAASPALLSAYFAILFWSLGIRASPKRQTKSGDKKCNPTEEQVRKRSSDKRGHGLHAQILAEIRHKPHYFGMGGLLGDRAGYFVHYWWFDVAPDHYEHVPRIVESLLVM